MLGFLKRNLFNIACGVVALGSIGLGVFGLTAMGKVAEELDGIRGMYGQFAAPTKKPLNDETISAERGRVETIQRYFDALMEQAQALDTYEPLPPPDGERFFPTPTDDGRRQFRAIYRVRFNDLLEQLKAGLPPRPCDIQSAQEAIDEELRAAESFGEDEKAEREAPGTTTPAEPEEKEHPSGLITEKEASQSAAARASIRRAHSLYCYASRESFDEFARVYDGLSPRPFDMWKAQVSLWIQQDVVASLARVNNKAAAKLDAQGTKAWVGVLPVKDLISIRVSDYLTGAPGMTGRDLRGEGPSFPPGGAEVVFTKNKSTELFDVVQFTLKMVVDSRDLLLIIDEICKDRFHTLLDVACVYERSALENLAMEGKIYGSEPTVKVVLDFETIFFGDPYRCRMPEANLAAIGKTCVKPTDEES